MKQTRMNGVRMSRARVIGARANGARVIGARANGARANGAGASGSRAFIQASCTCQDGLSPQIPLYGQHLPNSSQSNHRLDSQ